MMLLLSVNLATAWRVSMPLPGERLSSRFCGPGPVKPCVCLIRSAQLIDRSPSPMPLPRINRALSMISAALHVWPARVGELKLGRRRDDDFANRHRA